MTLDPRAQAFLERAAAAPGEHRRASLRRGERRGRERDRLRIGEDPRFHDAFSRTASCCRTGSCHSPGGDTLDSTSLGPHVPGSYS